MVKLGRRTWKQVGVGGMCARGLNPREECCLLRVPRLVGRVQRLRDHVGSETPFCFHIGRHHPTSLSTSLNPAASFAAHTCGCFWNSGEIRHGGLLWGWRKYSTYIGMRGIPNVGEAGDRS